VTVASWNNNNNKGENTQYTAKQITQQAKQQMQCSPDFVLAFQNPRSALSDILPQNLPTHSVVLGVLASAIQVNLPGNVVEHQSSASAMYASFPNAMVEPFALVDAVDPNYFKTEMEDLKKRLLNTSTTDNECWKAMIVYACGRGGRATTVFLEEMQSALPNIVVVGGICGQGYVSRTKYAKEDLPRLSVRDLKRLNQKLGGTMVNFLEKSELVDHVFSVSLQQQHTGLIHAEHSVFGVVLGGDVPLRSMVLRGV
jgi:hypothetical protein